MRRKPVIDIGICIDCGGCLEVAPTVFQRNEAMGYIEVADMTEYPVDLVQEAIMICPVQCITWEDE